MQEAWSALRVLVVEDSEFQRTMLEHALRALGIEQIRTAPDGAAALRVLRSFPDVDVVVTDVVMPDMDGIELIPLLPEVAGGTSLVFVSSEQWSLDVSAEIAKAHGLWVLGTVDKPATPQKLRPLLEAHLARRRAAHP